MTYLWQQNINPPTFASLTGTAQTDVLIIGGGMAGVLAARELAARGHDYLLLEAETLGSGTTRGTTAVLTAQHSTLYSELTQKFGHAKAAQYLAANLAAVDKFRQLAQGIDCDFEPRPSAIFSRSDQSTLAKEALTLAGLGIEAELTDRCELPFPIKAALFFPNMAQFHPLKFLYAVAAGLNIHENSPVQRIKDNIAYTDSGQVQARRIIFACHFPIVNAHGLYFAKMYQKRSFVVALENVQPLSATYVEDAESGLYLRDYQGLLILGGGDHRTGAKGEGMDMVKRAAVRYYPQASERCSWAAQDCTSLDGVPYIGRYSKATPHWYVASGFNEWGMTSSMLAADIIAEMIDGRQHPQADVFSPQRTMLRKQLFINAASTLGNFIRPTRARCSHLGCALKWNPAEHSWDCPCHGSRFDGDGQLLDNPALVDLHE